ncbi:Na+:solute symporter [Exilibacterium tricleocarpae]|uniref:Na+:solute symporter n=1 Tax=Exilibacterium tricleocarpae TaxID=2591008 RepID=A0A545U5D1_9GAMM|nr:sodium:solute symporter family protein [Exilibacterium tricleocarpae]TQV84679.1 Na+:solute symporter [Exilibacterium tricleocarpae]
MQLHTIDLCIIGLYLLSTVIVGLALKRRAGKNLKSYFQGGKRLPWYMLGLSNASGMFDISGTMWLVTLCFVYGMKSIWIPWLWPVFNQVFLAVFLSIWLRRSNVLTGAEWIRTRFGDGPGGRLSHIVVVVFAVISVLGFLSYGFVGVGKFMEIFIPWEVVSPYLPFSVAPQYIPHVYGIFFTLIATFYVVMGGMLSIVWTDVIQFTIMTASAVAIGLIAMNNVSHADLQAATPQGWSNPFFGWTLDLDWEALIAEVNTKIVADGYSLFSIVFMMMLFKGILISAAGPAPNYDMQKILATRSPREGALMSAFVSVALMPIRYFMIAGFAVLAVVYYERLDLMSGGRLDFENILPSAILQFAPTGILGLLLAGLLAAFMSTFASTVNAAPAYLVNDIYRRYINPQASNRRLIYASYLVSFLVVVISTSIGFFVQSINSVLLWLVSGLWGGYVVSNVLKWYWWRLNGYGFFWGMAAGIIGALSFPAVFSGLLPGVASDILPLYLFPVLLLFSGTVCVVTSLTTEPDDEAVLKHFYRTVRPWGFWRPIHDKVVAEHPEFEANPHFKRDMVNVLVGTIAQTTLVALPIFIVIRESNSVIATACILVVSAVFLKKNWYDNLDSEPAGQTDAPFTAVDGNNENYYFEKDAREAAK